MYAHLRRPSRPADAAVFESDLARAAQIQATAREGAALLRSRAASASPDAIGLGLRSGTYSERSALEQRAEELDYIASEQAVTGYGLLKPRQFAGTREPDWARVEEMIAILLRPVERQS